MTLMLLHTVPDPVALTQWATRKRWISADGDLGYAIHALLAEAFDGKPPAPFRYMNDQGLLAYSSIEKMELTGRVENASTDVRRLLGLDRFRLKPFPVEWPAGKRFNFEVRVRPVVRTNEGKERDLYQYRLEQRAPESKEDAPSRELVYQEWLASRLQAGNACRLVSSSMHGFSLRQVIRRQQKATDNHQRQPKGVTGPDVLFRGELEVGDSSAFQQLIAKGIGRHKSFGYGMLLLRPPGG